MEVVQRKRALKVLLFGTVLALIAILGVAGYASTQTFNYDVSGFVRVSGSGVGLISVTFDGASCTIDTAGATCSEVDMNVGETVTLAISLKNNLNTPIVITVTTTSGDSNVLTVTESSTNPSTLQPGQTGTFNFTVDALAAGDAGFNVQLSG